jgi:heptosyltransferase-2/heptosyltransferase-3
MALSDSLRDALAQRNIHLAAHKKQRTRKQALRGLLLRAWAALPIGKQRGGTQRVLLIRPDHLGDLLLTVPAIQLLKQARPDLSLHAWVGPWGKPAIDRLSELDSITTLAFPGFTRQPARGTLAPYRLAQQAADTLRQTGYDSALILRPDHWWGALVAHLAGIPHIIGFDTPDARPFLTRRLPFVPNQHSVIHSVQLAAQAAGVQLSPQRAQMHYPLTDADHAAAAALLSAASWLTDRRWICIHPGSGTHTKQWEAARWAAVAQSLATQLNTGVIFTGSAGEHPLCEAASAGLTVPSLNLAGQTDLPTLAALYQRAQVVLGPDSGPLHLAAAVHAPTVALFGPAQTAVFGTWGKPDRHAVLTTDIGCLGCGILDWPDDAPANHPCVRDITIQQVITAALRVAASTPSDDFYPV